MPMTRAPTILLTGATSGIGLAAARCLAAAGSTLILPVRDRARGRALQDALRSSGNARVHVVPCDLARFDDVRNLAATVLADHPDLDVIVHNAAVVCRRREVTHDGLERQFAVNHLAPFLLTHLLRGRLIENAPARVLVVASKVHFDATINFDDLLSERSYDAARAYNQSKLANVLFTMSLARALHGTGVTVNCVHPGVYATRLLGDLFDVPRLLRFTMRRNFPSPDAGGAIIARIATDPAYGTVTGAYFDELTRTDPAAEAADEGIADRLWEISEVLMGVRAGSD